MEPYIWIAKFLSGHAEQDRPSGNHRYPGVEFRACQRVRSVTLPALDLSREW